MRVLVAGATGFVGRLLVPALLSEGHTVIGMSRKSASTGSGIESRRADAVSGAGLKAALEEVEVAYYLVHSFESGHGERIRDRDRRAATNFGRAAACAGVRRIVFCSVADGTASRRSPHRQSRRDVEEILRAAVPDSVSLRTWLVLAPNNQFIAPLVRAIKQRGVLLLPPWRRYRFQPVDGRDLAHALACAGTDPRLGARTIHIGGPAVTTFEEVCRGLAGACEAPLRIVPLPLTPPSGLMARLIAAVGGGKEHLEQYRAVFDSARDGDVLPGENELPRLVSDPHSLSDSLRFAAGVG